MNGRGFPIFTATFVVVLLGLGAGYFVLQTYAPPSSASPPITPEVRQFSLRLRAAEAGEETQHDWTPATLVVNVGDTVILKITNGDPDTTHGFLLAAYNIAVPALPPGGTRTFRFRASRPGIFHFGCSVAGCSTDHAEQIGQFIVLGSR